MCSSTCRKAVAFALAACLMMMVGAAFAQGRLPGLPGPYVFPQTGDSPGPVTFTHASHVDEGAPTCTSCHPRVFKILTAGAATDAKPITHDAMKAGRTCGACHDGKKSFGFDDCTMCHRDQ